MGRCMSPKGSRTVLSGGKGGDDFKTLPIAIFAGEFAYHQNAYGDEQR